MEQLPLESQRSFKKGVWYVFHVKQDIIRLWLSSFNGVEKVYFNDEIVVESKSLTKTKVNHEFTVSNGDQYTVQLRIKFSARSATTICTLKCNGEAIKQIQLKPKETQQKQSRIILYSLFIVTIIISVMNSIYGISALFYILTPVAFLSFFLISISKGKLGLHFQDTTEFMDE